MAIYLRAFGEIDKAIAFYPVDVFKGLIWILKSDFLKIKIISLPQYEPTKRAILHLQGKNIEFIPILSQTIMIIASEPRHFLNFLNVYNLKSIKSNLKNKSWHDDIALIDIILSEIYRENNDHKSSNEYLHSASEWILKSGSQEHLCLLSHSRAKYALSKGDLEAAYQLNNEAINIASECGFLLYHIDSSVTFSSILFRMNKIDEAIKITEKILNHCRAEFIHNRWAESKAMHLKANIFLKLGDIKNAKSTLEKTIRLKNKIGDKSIIDSQNLMKTIN